MYVCSRVRVENFLVLCMSPKPYSIRLAYVRKSPFASVESVKKALQQHKKHEKIGFTQLSSLRSMGLLKRVDGTYRLGDKYKK